MRLHLLPVVLAGAASLLLVRGVHAHEPVFGIGPETIYEDGVGLEVGWDFEDEGDERTVILENELIYGLTQRTSLSIQVPQILRRHTDEGARSGLGDILVRGKYQFWKRDRLNASDKATLILGVKLPTGSDHGRVPLGTGSIDPLFGLAVGHESRTSYAFGSFRYLLRTRRDGLDRGDRVLFDLAAGFRPWQMGYLEPDLVFLVEFNGVTTLRDRRSGEAVGSTGGNVGWLGPTALLSYRNVMTKAGVQIPLYSSRRGTQPRPELRAVLSLEYHF